MTVSAAARRPAPPPGVGGWPLDPDGLDAWKAALEYALGQFPMTPYIEKHPQVRALLAASAATRRDVPVFPQEDAELVRATLASLGVDVEPPFA